MKRQPDADTVYGFTAVAVCLLGFLAFQLFFAPGWANGWPFGFRQADVWPSGLAVMAFAITLIGLGGVGIAAGVERGHPVRRWPPTGWYVLLGLICLPAAAAAAWEVYEVLRR
jgi:hypothetical protein